MKTKRFYYETEEQKTTKTKGWIEIDMDYTQLYSCFNNISSKIQLAITYKLLFWLLANKTNDSNGIDTSASSFKDFNKHLEDGSERIISYRTYLRAMTELKNSGAITQVGKGQYYFNPNIFWKDDVSKRIELIQEEKKDGNYVSINPVNNIL